jgi:hypothetical protein
MVARLAASATAGITAMCLLLAVVHIGRLPVTRTETMGALTHAVELPNYGAFGTDHAFLGKADGAGQSTKDHALFQQLAIKHAKKAAKHVVGRTGEKKGAREHWKPFAADQLFHRRGVHFKGFNHKKAATFEHAKQQQQRMKKAGSKGGQQLWIQPDNGVYTTINVRGMEV